MGNKLITGSIPNLIFVPGIKKRESNQLAICSIHSISGSLCLGWGELSGFLFLGEGMLFCFKFLDLNFLKKGYAKNVPLGEERFIFNYKDFLA
jgi:hypothetical protein